MIIIRRKKKENSMVLIGTNELLPLSESTRCMDNYTVSNYQKNQGEDFSKSSSVMPLIVLSRQPSTEAELFKPIF